MHSEQKYLTYFPSFDEDTHSGTKENHPTCVGIVVDEVEKNDNLNENIRNNLTKPS